MTRGDLVSVIVRSFNREDCIGIALESLLSQSHKNWEAIVVDNYSVDRTCHVVNSYRDSRIKLIQIKNHGIIAKSFNAGLSISEGKYTAILDSDDWWEKDKLSTCVEVIDSGFDVAYHDMAVDASKYRGNYKLPKVMTTRDLDSNAFLDLYELGNGLINSSVIARKSLIESIGGMREDRSLLGNEDFDLWLRLSLLTNKFRRINKVLGTLRFAGDNLTNDLRSIRSLKNVYRFHINQKRRPGLSYYYSCGSSYYRLQNYRAASRYFSNALLSDHLSSVGIGIKARSLLRLGACVYKELCSSS